MPVLRVFPRKNKNGKMSQEWRKFQREWLRPEIIFTKFEEYRNA